MGISMQADAPMALNARLARVFAVLDQESIVYCVLRGYEELLCGVVDGDVDLLVAQKQFGRFQEVLTRCGFVALSRWGQSPHSFFIGYDEVGDCWIKLDVVTELAYGRPIPVLRTPLALACLDGRRRYGPCYVPAVEDEWLTLLLHCLLDKGGFELGYRVRLMALVGAVRDTQRMARQVACCFPPSVGWCQLQAWVGAGDWDAIMQVRPFVVACLSQGDRWRVRWRWVGRRVLRVLDRRSRVLRVRGVSVALLAADGAGRAMLVRGLERAFYLPVRSMDVGVNLGGAGREFGVVRVFGALNAFFRQVVRCRVAAWYRWCGCLVILDRYALEALVEGQQSFGLLKAVWRWLVRLLCPLPDLVVCLDAPAEVVCQRKQGQEVPVVVVDAMCTPAQVRQQVTALIWERYALGRDRAAC